MRLASCALAVVALALALGACGESSEGKAKSTVCDARDDIGKQVDELKSLTPSTVSRGAVTSSIAAITKDLDAISGAQGSLSGERRSELEAANTEFKATTERTSMDLHVLELDAGAWVIVEIPGFTKAASGAPRRGSNESSSTGGRSPATSAAIACAVTGVSRMPLR